MTDEKFIQPETLPLQVLEKSACRVFFIILTNFFAVAGPRYIRIAIDTMTGPFVMEDVAKNAELYVLFALVSGFFLFLVRQNIIVASRHIEYDLKNDYYRHLEKLPRRFYNTTSTGELISRGTNDLNAVRDFLGPGIMYSLNTFFRLLFALVAMIALSPKLTFFALLPAPLLSWSVYKIGRSMQKRTKSIQESYAGITNLVQENLSGIRVVKSYTRELFEISRFEKLNQQYYTKNLSLGKLQALFFAFLTALTAFSLLPVVWIGGINVIEGSMSIGGIAQFIVYVTMLSWPIISIGWVTSIIQKASSAQARIDEIFAMEPEENEKSTRNGNADTAGFRGALSFENVSFSYPGAESEDILKEVSFSIEAGSKTAIVGATGSGKTSLVNLIPRLYEPTGGAILLDGKDIRSMPTETLRELVGFVPQINSFSLTPSPTTSAGEAVKAPLTKLLPPAGQQCSMRRSKTFLTLLKQCWAKKGSTSPEARNSAPALPEQLHGLPAFLCSTMPFQRSTPALKPACLMPCSTASPRQQSFS